MSTADLAPVRPYPPVSIVGVGCRVPGASGITEFWRMLLEGRDATGQPPPGRLGSRHGGYLDDVESFDNDWFAISGREAAMMDPQQRLALEVTVEAIDDAGIGYRTRGSGAAVIFGACGYDHGISVLGHGGHDAPYAVTGSALSIIANRLSYVLDLHGPSLVVDSACSSSLAAVDLALRLLADDAVPFAIVGGVNLTLLPHTSDYMAQGGFLTPDGRCKPFDAAADGYTRGDGCAVVILQRTADALRDGNRVYAEIVGSAVGSDGRSNGLYAPNGRAQQDTLRTAWAKAGLDPHTSGYVECHGTGTFLGDAVEVGALAAVLTGGDPTWIGSIKSNIGHLEAAAGVTGLIKTALSIRDGVIAPTINFRAENPLLRLADHGLRVPTEPIDWTATPVVDRRAGVSSFGFGGTNAHVVLRGISAPLDNRGDEPPVLIPVSGHDVADVHARARYWADLLDPAVDATPGSDATPDSTGASGPVGADTHRNVGADLDTRSASTDADGTTHAATEPNDTAIAVANRDNARSVRQFGSAAARLIPEGTRAAVIAHDADEAAGRLRALAQGERGVGVIAPSSLRRRGGLLFLFSGQGGQHPKMGRALAARYPVFARAVTETADAIVAAGGPRVWTPRKGFALTAPGAGNGNRRDATELVQPAIFTFQVALAELLASWGIRADAVVGHSLGEVAGAAVSGALSLAGAARVVVQRSRILALLDGHGAMAVVEAAPDEAANLVEPLRAMVGIAAINGPRSVVVSGAPRYVDTVIRRAKRRRLFAQRIAVDFAAHSPQVAAVLPEFRDALDDLDPLIPDTPVYSTAHPGKTITTATMDASYWADNASSTVELAAALERAAADGLSTVLEIAPHPLLITAVREYADFRDAAHPVTTRDDEAGAFLACLGRLYTEGRSVDWSAHGPFIAPPPPRRWTKRRFPLISALDPGAPATSNAQSASIGDSTSVAVGIRSAPGRVSAPAGSSGDGGSHVAESAFPADDLAEHVVQGAPTVPAVFWLRRLLDLAHMLPAGASATMVADFVVHEQTDLTALHAVSYRGDAGSGSVRAEVTGAGTLASARLAGDPTPTDIVAWLRVVDANRATRHRMRAIAPDAFYADLRGRQLSYGPCFRTLRSIEAGHECALGTFDFAPLHRSATLDGCLHLLAAASYDDLSSNSVPLPIGIESAWLSTEPDRVVLEVHAFVRRRTGTGCTGDIIGTDQHGVPVLALSGVQIRFAELGTLPSSRDESHSPMSHFRREVWQPIHLGPVADTSRDIAHPVAQASADRTIFNADSAASRNSSKSTAGGSADTERRDPGAPTCTAIKSPSAGATGPNTDAVPSSVDVSGGVVGRADSATDLAARGSAPARRALVIGESALAIRLTRELDRALPTERVAREPDAAGPIVSAVLAGRTATSRTAVVLVWPTEIATLMAGGFSPTGAGAGTVPTTGRLLDLIQRIQSDEATASLTVVLPDHGLPAVSTAPVADCYTASEHGGAAVASSVIDPHGDSSIPMAIAGLVRSLQLESGRDVRLVWTDPAAASIAVLRGLIVESAAGQATNAPEELRIELGTRAIRRFAPAYPRSAASGPIDANGTYVVTGGLGALGAVAVRWLLDAGAHDVVVLTRSPRPVPALLDGLEDRIVVVRCDAADHNDLSHALNDIRECGSTIRGIVHAAGTLEDAAFDAVTSRQLARMFAAKYRAAGNLIELTAADPADFVLLFSSATGALGAPGQAAYASANAAMDALALAQPGRRIVSIGWGVWESGLAEVAGGAAHLRRAGISAFSTARGAELLAQALRYDGPYLLALDYTPAAATSPVAARLRNLLAHNDVPTDGRAAAPSSSADPGTTSSSRTAIDGVSETEPLTATIRTVLAATLDLAPEHLDPTADFNELGLSSLLGIEMRRNLEARLDIRLSTAELFRHPTITALGAALAERVAAANSGETA